MNPALTFQSPRAVRLIHRIKQEFLKSPEDLEVYQLAEALHMSRRNINQYVQYLLLTEQIHIGSWRSRDSWGPVKRYRLGPGRDAPRPRPRTSAELSARHRQKNPDRSVKDMMAKRLEHLKPRRDPIVSALFGKPP